MTLRHVNTSQEKIARIHIRMLKTVQAAAQHGLPMNERRFCHIDKKYTSHPKSRVAQEVFVVRSRRFCFLTIGQSWGGSPDPRRTSTSGSAAGQWSPRPGNHKWHWALSPAETAAPGNPVTKNENIPI
jgi:hypothetical protein